MGLQISRRSVSTGDFARGIVSFGKTKIDQDAMAGLVVEQEICWFDVPMYDAPTVTVVKPPKEAAHVFADVGRI